jgi:hypothetical protein
VLGLACCWAAAALLLWHAPTLTEEPPRWTFAVAGVLFFLQQTLDAIDGKQVWLERRARAPLFLARAHAHAEQRRRRRRGARAPRRRSGSCSTTAATR